MAQNFNCTILWKIENFFPQCGNNMCVSTEVEIFNSEKWKLEISPWTEQSKKTLKMVKLSGDEEMPTEKQVSLIDKDGRVIICHGNPTFINSKKEINFDMYYLNTEWLQNTTLKIELKFPVDGLAFSTTVRTVLSNAKCSFVWSINAIPKLFEFPIPVYFPRSPQCNLMFLVEKDEFDAYNGKLAVQSDKHQPSFFESDSVSTTDNDIKDIFVCYSIVRCVDGEDHLTEGSFLLKNKTDFHHIDSEFSTFQKNSDLKVCFSFFDGTSESVQQEYVYSFLRSENSGVREKFAVGHSLFKNMKFHDVTLKAGDKQFKAHKSVLSYVSPVFCAMFENEMSESKTGQVLIEDVGPSTMKRMLKFIYTDEIDDVSFEQYEKLLAAANKYTISSLTEVCSDRLVSLLTEENIMRILHLGYLYNNDKLKGAGKSLFSLAPKFIFEFSDWKEYMESCFPRGASAPSVEKLREFVRKVKESKPFSISSIFRKK